MPQQPLPEAPESTAARVALWRALHTEIDAPPHIIDDTIGLRLLAPDAGWRERPDMHPQGTRGFRAGIVARARFIEDLLAEKAAQGLAQYVLLGAGLDTFAQRRPDFASRLTVYEVDQPGPQAWKRRRLAEEGYDMPDWLRLVPVDFETAGDWWMRLAQAGFDAARPALVASTGVSMYLTREAVAATLRQIAGLAPGSVLAMTFILPVEMCDPEEQPMLRMVYDRARAAGTPFVSFFKPEEMLSLARQAGFSRAEYVATDDVTRRYFSGRGDGLKPSTGEVFLVATV
ncbi:MAG TPA: class I SAM-dependent methyltransferase [Burkholderiales bacterium]|jgi:methyltransferase (TIGR00027 family)